MTASQIHLLPLCLRVLVVFRQLLISNEKHDDKETRVHRKKGGCTRRRDSSHRCERPFLLRRSNCWSILYFSGSLPTQRLSFVQRVFSGRYAYLRTPWKKI